MDLGSHGGQTIKTDPRLDVMTMGRSPERYFGCQGQEARARQVDQQAPVDQEILGAQGDTLVAKVTRLTSMLRHGRSMRRWWQTSSYQVFPAR